MQKISIKTNEKLLIDKYKEQKYYCPHCRILFKKDSQDYTFKILKKNYYLYKCTSCNKNFKRQTYQEKNKSGKHYHLEKNKEIIKKDIREHIKQAVVELWMEGYNISDIHTITHFSKTLIEEKTKEFRNENTHVYTFEELRNILESKTDEKNFNLLPWRDRRTRKIRKALEMGCSVSQLATILKMSNSTISSARKGSYLLERGNFAEDDEIKKQQVKIFLKESLAPHNVSQRKSQRRTVKIDKEKQIITIFGIIEEENQKK